MMLGVSAGVSKVWYAHGGGSESTLFCEMACYWNSKRSGPNITVPILLFDMM